MRNLILGAVFATAVAASFAGHFGRPDKPMPIPQAEPGKSATAPRKMTENVVAYHTQDRKLAAAKDKARATLPRFVKLMQQHPDGVNTVKFPLTLNGETEHIWLQVLAYEDGRFIGMLANDPVNGTKYKRGDRMDVAKADVEDWMVRSGDALYGGYSSRVILEDMGDQKSLAMLKLFRD